MKKLASLMLGLSLILGSAAFAQDKDKKEDTKKEGKKDGKKKAKKKAPDAEKK